MLRVALATVLLLAVPAVRAGATIFTVTTTSDGADGTCNAAHCSLRDAVIAANADAAGDTIVVPAGTYGLGGEGDEDFAASGDLDIRASVAITGAGAGVTIIDGGDNDRLIDIVESAIVVISDLTLRNGRTPPGDTQGGGAILWNEPISGKTLFLMLDGVVVTGNSAGDGDGGGIKIDQDKPASSVVTITNSTISGNTMDDGDGGGLHLCCENLGVTITTTTIADNVAVDDPSVAGLNGEGGGIYHCCTDTTLTIRDSTIRDNSGPTQGGGIYACCGVASNTMLTLERSTVSGNTALGTATAQGDGGGIEGEGAVTLVNSTISGNRAFRDGGGIENEDVLVMRNVTVASNEAGRGGGFYEDGLATTLVNTLFADNMMTAGAIGNCGVGVGTEPLVSEGGNLSSDATCPLAGTGDQTGVAVLLAPLGDYGGATQTHALPPGSAAIDVGRDTGCQAVDQRGVPRPVDGDNDGSPHCDAGAFERGSALEDCDNGVDDNANGLVDCLDYDCTGQPFCKERCDNCVDDDGDGAVDRDDTDDCQERADAGGAGSANPERARFVLQCAVALQKAGAKVVRGRTKTLQDCLARLETCVQRQGSAPSCLQRAGARCMRSLARLPALDDQARATIGTRCAALTRDELRLVSGLGFAAEDELCDDLDVPALDGPDAIAACVLAQHRCGVERLVALETPRAGELFTLGGITAGDVLGCAAVPTTGTGDGLGARGKRLDACDRTRRKAAAKLVTGTTTLAGGCARRILACRQQKAADPDCIPKAQAACGRSAAKLDALVAAVGRTIAKKCDAPTVGIGELLGATGAGFQSQASLCKALGVPSLGDAGAITDCLTRHHACRAQQLLERELPRLDELLTIGGLALP